MKQDGEHRSGTLASILAFLLGASIIAAIVNAAIFFGGKVIEWLGR
jgi:hypothetical protein